MKTRKFDTQVQYLKYKVLREVARHAWDDNLVFEHFNDIAKTVVKGKEPTMRCCIYKERAIVSERIKLACGGDKSNLNVIEVIDIACDECPLGGYKVTESCRGCIAHRCEDACKVGAISFDKNQKAVIDKDKCVNCGKCAAACPYSAIQDFKRPCERSCKVGAISMDKETYAASIDNDKCISCGACVYMCPFGACMDKSSITDVIKILKESDGNKNYKVYAVTAPAINAQFTYAKTGQVVAAIKKLGFHSVVEAALGADMVALEESAELAEKGFLTTSCCPAFVEYIHKFYPTLVPNISHNLSPMAKISQYIKTIDPTSKIVFIGPCTAKKMEIKRDEVKDLVGYVLTFEELQALIDSRDIPIAELEDEALDNASYFGRIFARSGGVTDAVKQAIKEQNLDIELSPAVCNGIEECKKPLLLASKGIRKNNFIEGMACVGGCIGGAGNLTHEEKDAKQVDKYAEQALEKTITDAVSMLK
ncbi:MAG: 4Fe-4S dicluster domain-containing protein [Ruminococcus sp.]|nr:4Fe-4S dicluster domain-containing protein [Ruminococcus sp.]